MRRPEDSELDPREALMRRTHDAFEARTKGAPEGTGDVEKSHPYDPACGCKLCVKSQEPHPYDPACGCNLCDQVELADAGLLNDSADSPREALMRRTHDAFEARTRRTAPAPRRDASSALPIVLAGDSRVTRGDGGGRVERISSGGFLQRFGR